MRNDMLPVDTEIIFPYKDNEVFRGVIVEVDEHDPIWPYYVMPLDSYSGKYRDAFWISDEEIVIVR